jgi:hypothetical protein
MKLKKMLAGHLLMLVLVFPHAVSAEDFTFNVGVNLSNLHEDVAKVLVACSPLRPLPTGGDLVLGQGSKELIVPANGIINTTVQLKFNANPGKNPGDAESYTCLMWFFNNSGAFGPPLSATSSECSNSENKWKCAKLAATFVGNSFTGPIP